LKVIISRAFHLRRIEEENTRLQNALATKQVGLAGIVGQSRQMQEVFATIRKVATSEVPVLIMGESGTGKEMVAQAIHQLSLRKEAPFIAINCGAIPENLLESELFGYEKGAFTSAAGRVQGKVEFAHRGTLFLDEIGELPGNLQVKLLRFLQEKQIQRVGGREDIAVDARVVCATNINMEKAIAAGSFREDLYYRIAVISVKLPPLRERGDDIHLLANLFLKRSCDQFNKKLRGFTPAAREAIETYEWPGNVRELENRVQRAVIMTEATSLDPADLGFTDWHPGYTGTKKELTLREAKERVEREMIAATIRNHQGNVAKAAEILGISRPTLYDLMRKHGIESH
jgi:two-component system NtrC family response regulator